MNELGPNRNRLGDLVLVGILVFGVLSLAFGGIALVVMALTGYGEF